MTASSTTSAPAPSRHVPFVGGRVRAWRIDRGWTAPDLLKVIHAQGVRLSLSALTAIERDENGPMPATAAAIAAALGRSVRDFHPDAPKEDQP